MRLTEMIWRVVEANWDELLVFVAVYAAIVATILSVSALLLRRLRDAVWRTSTTTVSNQVLDALKKPARFWAVLLAFILTLRWVSLSFLPKPVMNGIGIVFLVILLYSVTMAASRMAIIFLDYRLRQQDSSQQVTTLTANLIRVVVSIPAILTLLRVFDINLTPALTALGVGGIAVSLALQGTLANLFSGFWVSTAGQVHKGDFIRLETGREGWVEDIRWRITTLRTPQNNLVIIPNSKLAEAIVENFSQPIRRLATSIQVGVDYASDIDQVERCLLEEAMASIGEVDGLLDDPPPVVRFSPGFGDSSLNFTLAYHVAEYQQQFLVAHHLRRRIHKRFLKESINMPFPTRTITMAPGTLGRAMEKPGPDGAA